MAGKAGKSPPPLPSVPYVSNVIIVLLIISLIQVTHMRIKDMHLWGMYDSMKCMQLTVFTIHLTPIFALRSLIPVFMVSPKDLTVQVLIMPYVLLSVANRLNITSDSPPMSAFNAVITLVELSAVFFPLSVGSLKHRILPLFAVMNPAIIMLFWLGIIGASLSESFSFMPIDRHIRASGWSSSYFSENEEAAELLVREVVGHGIMQLIGMATCLVLIHLLARSKKVFEMPAVSGAVLKSMVLYVFFYAAITVGMSVATAKEGDRSIILPYNLHDLLFSTST
jgi:hypothetical protein